MLPQGVVQELRGTKAAGQQITTYRRAETLSQARRGGPGGGGGAAGDASAMEEDTMPGAGGAAIAQVKYCTDTTRCTDCLSSACLHEHAPHAPQLAVHCVPYNAGAVHMGMRETSQAQW